MGPAFALATSSRRSLDFSRRASRSEFWWAWIILFCAVAVILPWRASGLSGPLESAVATVAATALALPMIALGTRRLVDAGGWRWLFVPVFVFGVAARIVRAIPVPGAGSPDNLIIQFDDRTTPASDLGHYPFLRTLHDILPWIGRPLAALCLILALLPSRPDKHVPQTAEVTP